MSWFRDQLFGGKPGTKRFPEVRPPVMSMDESKRRLFERFAVNTLDHGDGHAHYDLPYPKHEFVRWLSQSRSVLFHGSPGECRDQLDPRPARGLDRAGRQRAVYATPWPLYAMWFAVLNRRWPFIWTTNGSRALVEVDQWERVYWFKVNRWARRSALLVNGTLYVFARDKFSPAEGDNNNDQHPGQWVCREPVRPLVGLAVSPHDFPFASHVTSR